MQDRKARHAMPAAGEASADFLYFKPEPKASALPAAVAPELAAPPAAVESGPDVAPPYGVGKLTRSVHLRSGRSPQLNALRDLLVGNALAQEAGSQLVQHHAPWRNLTSKHLDAGASHMRCTRCKVQPGAPTTVMHQGAGAHRSWCTVVHGATRCMGGARDMVEIWGQLPKKFS